MTLDIFLSYFGALTLALIIIYGIKNFSITLIAGFIVFCIFFFSFDIKKFQWNIIFILQQLKNAGFMYLTGFILAAIIYKIFPPKPAEETIENPDKK